MKAMLATDYEEAKLRFPVLAQPKIDGVRGVNFFGTLTGRSLKQHRNKYTTKFYSHSCLAGMDGERDVTTVLVPATHETVHYHTVVTVEAAVAHGFQLVFDPITDTLTHRECPDFLLDSE